MLVYPSGFSGERRNTGSPIKESLQPIKSVQLNKSVQPIESVQPNKSVQPNESVQIISSFEMSQGRDKNFRGNVKVKPFKVKSHRRGKQNSIRIYQKSFNWLGNNIAGARSKWASVQRWVRLKSPSILSLQETKFQVAGKHSLNGYICYEHLRKEKTNGGGLFMALKTELSPALVRDGGDNVEALTVDICVKKMKIACTTAYGPQEKDTFKKKDDFWQYLDEEAKRAQLEGKGFILQGDLNSWIGSQYIANDPRTQNGNGKRMANFVERNQLIVVNGLQLCNGLITRSRKCKDIYEKSILDYFVVCKSILGLITSMEIDEDKKNIPTNYTQVRKGGKATDSDHVSIELCIDIKILPTRPARNVMYNFKNEQGRHMFQKLTSETESFTKCFDSMEPWQKQCTEWKVILESYCKQAFPVIRLREKKPQFSAAD